MQGFLRCPSVFHCCLLWCCFCLPISDIPDCIVAIFCVFLGDVENKRKNFRANNDEIKI